MPNYTLMPYFTSCPVLNNSVSSTLAQFSVVYKWSLLKCAFIWKKLVLFEVTWSPAVHICWCFISGQIGVFTDNPWECCLVIYCALAHLNSPKKRTTSEEGKAKVVWGKACVTWEYEICQSHDSHAQCRVAALLVMLPNYPGKCSSEYDRHSNSMLTGC